MTTSRILPLALLALTSLGCHTTHLRESIDDSAGVATAKRAYFDSWTKGAGTTFTVDKLSRALDTSEAFLSFDGMSQEKTVIQGWKKFAAIWGPGMNAFETASLTESRPLSTWVGDDTAITASIARIQGKLPDGTVLDMLGHLTLGYQRRDGDWRIVHEHMSLGVKE